jgi:XkdN-like tail assembly chaperone
MDTSSTTDTRIDADPTAAEGGIQPVGEGEEFPVASEPQAGDPSPQEPGDGPQANPENPGELSDAELLERAQKTDQLKDLTEGEEQEARTGAAAVAAARDARSIGDGEAASALDWFLNEDPSAAANETETKELNFGTQDSPKWVPWTIKAVPMEVMRAIRKKAQNSRLARQTGETDEYRVNLEIVVEGTVDPDIKEATRILNEQGRFSGDPVDALRAKFQPKPGYIAQLAGQIMTLSGFNDEDVRDAERAAKN